jgi:transcriptional regulator GlxA family with amidase domain
MKNISILVPERAVMASITDPRYMFMAVNSFLKAEGRPEAFKVQLVGLSSAVKLDDGLFTVHTDKMLSEVKSTDLIIIPALSGDMQRSLQMNASFNPWIVEQHKKGAEVVSLCVGAFLLASTGLLCGKKCSTHWLFADKFRSMFPEVELVDGTIITEENGIYSSGGASSYWNLLLYLVEKYTDRDLAIHASKYFALQIERKSQSSFVIFNGQKEHEDDFIKRIQEFIEANYRQKITVDQLSDKFGIGRRSLERRFKKATCHTLIEYIQRVKIEAAKRSFERCHKTISEVMYDVGYTDTKAFRDVFKKITGMTPVDYKNKYN